MEIAQEYFKEIDGYEGLYEVSNKGRVKSLKRQTLRKNGRILSTKERILKPGFDADGYKIVGLSKFGKTKTITIHRLVALNFLKETINQQVNHKDGDRTNNNLSNLEWVTVSENLTHSYRELGRKSAMKGRINTGSGISAKKRFSKKIKCYREGKLIKTFNSITSAVKELELTNTSCVSRVAKGERKHHKGYFFKYD